MSPFEEPKNRMWASLDLMETLLRLAETQHYNEIKELCIYECQCPDILILSLLLAKCEWQTLQQELSCRLLQVILASFPRTTRLVSRLWTI
eukprot:Pgem_evm1s8048